MFMVFSPPLGFCFYSSTVTGLPVSMQSLVATADTTYYIIHIKHAALNMDYFIVSMDFFPVNLRILIK